MINLRRDIKDLQRLRKILLVFLKEGFGYYIAKARLKTHLPLSKRFKKENPLPDKQEQAVRLRRAFTKLGPTFVKLGQLLSLRPDLVPVEFAKEFEKLQDKVPPFNYKKVEEIIQEDFGKTPDKLFENFEKKSFASASIAQVHKAKLKSGGNVVVKIQRPEVKEIIDADLDILFFMAHTLEKRFKEIKNYRPVEVVKEFALWTRRELDFREEGNNAKRLKEAMKNNSNVKIPNVYEKFSSKRVLTMDFVDGIKLNQVKKSKKKIVMTYFTSILEQALLYGFFHADPHPANIFITKDEKLVYLDYGIVGELSVKDRNKIIKFIRTLSEKDPDKSMDIIISLAKNVSNADLDNFKKDSLPILRDIYGNSIKEASIGHALYGIIGIGAKNGILFDPNHVLMAKTIYQAEGLAAQLDPTFKVKEGLDIFAKKYLSSEFNPIEIAKKVTGTLFKQKNLLLKLPEHVVKIIEKLEKGNEKQHCEKEHIKEIEEHLIQTNSRKNLGSVVLILFVAALTFFYLEGRRTMLGLPLSVIVFIVAIISFGYYIITKKRNNWRDEL